MVVSSESIEKSLIVSNNSTIFKLRKLVMEAYGLQGDFIMYNTEMRRDITFV